MKIENFCFKSDYKGFAKESSLSFSNNKINLLIGQNGSGKSAFFEALLKSFHFLVLLDLEKKLEYSFDYIFDFTLSYSIDNKRIKVISMNQVVKVYINEMLLYSFNRQEIPKEYNIDSFFPEKIVLLTNSSNDKLYQIAYSFEIIRRIKENLQGFSFQGSDYHETARLIFVNENSIDLLTETIAMYYNQSNNKSHSEIFNEIMVKISSQLIPQPLQMSIEFDKNTFFINSWYEFYNNLEVTQYVKKSSYKQYYENQISLRDSRFSRFFEMKNTNSENMCFRNLSSGEFDYLRLFMTIDVFKERSNVLFIADEIDAHFNPKWCKEYIADLYDYLNSNSQILITTNNPFAISDMQNQHIAEFKDHKQNDVNLQTFGTNPNLLNNYFYEIKGTLSKIAQMELDRIETEWNSNKNKEMALEHLGKMGQSPEKAILEYLIKRG